MAGSRPAQRGRGGTVRQELLETRLRFSRAFSEDGRTPNVLDFPRKTFSQRLCQVPLFCFFVWLFFDPDPGHAPSSGAGTAIVVVREWLTLLAGGLVDHDGLADFPEAQARPGAD